MGKDLFVTISENKDEVVKAMPATGGVLIKSITKYEGGQSESTYFLKDGVLVNHGSEKEPDWRLNR